MPTAFFCCQPEYERNVARALCLAFVAALFAPIPASIFDGLWSVPTPSRSARKAAFQANYRLGRAVVIDPVTELPEEVIFILDLAFWTELTYFAATPEGSCTEPCKVYSWDIP